MKKLLAIDLFCGLGGWTEGLLAEGYNVIGFDIERHDYSAQLVIQDVLTLHGRQFKDAALIVASPPCQEYSYMAMPWSKAKAIAAEYQSGVRDVEKLTALFDACFRIQREASDAAGHKIPLIVENVRGAQPWVGRSKWNFGSFHLWGDVPALMPITQSGLKLPGNNGPRMWADREVKRLCDAGGFKTTGKQAMEGTKNGSDWFSGYGGGFGWDRSQMRQHNSKSPARKAASAQIAKIPFNLARHIAWAYNGRH